MKKLLIIIVLLNISSLSFGKVLKEQSSLDFNASLKKIETAITSKGLTIFAKIDHQKSAKDVSLAMKPSTVLIFGNPKVGTLLMNDNIEWSYELPLKIAVFEDSNGKVWFMTRNLAKDIKSSKEQKERIQQINNLLQSLLK